MTASDFDLANLDAQEEGTLDIKHPKTQQPIGWIWTFYGPGHPATVALAARISKEMLGEAREHRQAQLNGKKIKVEEESLDHIRGRNADNIIARTKSFTPIKLNGELIEYSAEKARELLLDRSKGWLFNQVSEFLRAEENFIQPSATS